ncbi:MAG: hypothetical protein JXJ20_07150 [Anaerolineae bacterium]|nr:hypothetical protein [Anaerolineae bacterium]
MTDNKQPQSIACNRRRFLPLLLQEIFVTFDSFKGKPVHQLTDLGKLPDEEIALIKPVINPQYQVFTERGHVCARHKETGSSLQLFAMQQANLEVFNRINGQITLGEIGAQVAQELDWDEDAAFEHVKELFLSLAVHLVCVPKNTPDLDDQDQDRA